MNVLAGTDEADTSETRWTVLDVVVFVGIALLGVARLPEPFFGDQALNMLMGKVIATGGAPYTDLWDLKYPGVFFFFAAGGSLFGFSEIGVHLFELLWMLVLALAVRVTAEHFLESRVAIGLAPALTVGTYYALTTNYHLTQTEALVGLPLLVSLACVAAAVRSDSRRRLLWLLASGLSAGVVFIFKAPYVALPMIFWVLGWVELRRTSSRDVTPRTLRLAWPLFVGAMLPVSATVVYLAGQDALGVAWRTFTVHPAEAASQGGVHLQRLVDGVVWFAQTFRVPLVLACIGAWHRVGRGWDPLTAALVAWVIGGALLIWVQVISWWPYHYLMLLVPVGLLAAQGVETLWRTATTPATSRGWRTTAVAAILLLSALYFRQVEPVRGTLSSVFRARPLPFDIASMRRYQSATDPEYADWIATTSFLREPASHAGPIYVFGNPILYHLADRPPAVPLLVWGTSPPAGQWGRVMEDLETAVPAYILVDDEALESMAGHNPTMVEEGAFEVRSRLEAWYRELRTDAGGTWYIREDLAAEPPGP